MSELSRRGDSAHYAQHVALVVAMPCSPSFSRSLSPSLRAQTPPNWPLLCEFSRTRISPLFLCSKNVPQKWQCSTVVLSCRCVRLCPKDRRWPPPSAATELITPKGIRIGTNSRNQTLVSPKTRQNCSLLCVGRAVDTLRRDVMFRTVLPMMKNENEAQVKPPRNGPLTGPILPTVPSSNLQHPSKWQPCHLPTLHSALEATESRLKAVTCSCSCL